MRWSAGLFVAGNIVVASVVSSAAFAQQPDLMAPDLILTNGKLLTMDSQSTVVEALAVRDSKIVALGSSAAIKSRWPDRRPK